MKSSPLQKNLPLIINGILLIAVAVLFYLHFAPKQQEEVSMVSDSTVVNAKGKAVVFVDTDSLTKNFEFSKTNSAILEGKKKNMEASLLGQQTTLENKFKEYQNKYDALTPSERADVEANLNNMKMKLEKDAYDQQNILATETAKLSDSLFIMVQDFLKDYAKTNGHIYVMQYQPGMSPILYGDPALNVTADVINKLNALYKIKLANKVEEDKDKKKK